MKSPSNCTEGALIDLSLTHPVILASLQTHEPQTPAWWDKTFITAASFDPKLSKPIYYCTHCHWIENGGHRIAIAHYLGHPKITVEIHHNCISDYNWAQSHRAGWRIPWELTPDDLSPTPYHNILKTIKHSEPKRDHDLINHSYYKWGQMKRLSLHDKSVLDIGCHSGIISNLCAYAGALRVFALEERTDIYKVGQRLAYKYGFNNVVYANGALGKHSIGPDSFDIVLCLGMLHKFRSNDYETHLATLCTAAKETLVIEAMIRTATKPDFAPKPGSPRYGITNHIPSKHLTTLLTTNGFKVTNRVRSKRHPDRALWIARRLP